MPLLWLLLPLPNLFGFGLVNRVCVGVTRLVIVECVPVVVALNGRLLLRVSGLLPLAVGRFGRAIGEVIIDGGNRFSKSRLFSSRETCRVCDEVVVVVVVGSGGHKSSSGGVLGDWERLGLDFERDLERARKKLYSCRCRGITRQTRAWIIWTERADDRDPGRLERTLFSDFLFPTTSFIFGISIMCCSGL